MLLSARPFVTRLLHRPARLWLALAIVGAGYVGFDVLKPMRPIANVAYDDLPDPALGERGRMLALRGRTLRRAIDQEFVRLYEAHRLANTEAPLTGVVTRHIPVGSPIEDANLILRFAGFQNRARPSLGQRRLFASIDRFVALSPFGDTVMSVEIESSDDVGPGGVAQVASARVERLTAKLFTIYP